MGCCAEDAAPPATAKIEQANWRIARTLALLGKKQVEKAEEERKRFMTAVAAVPQEAAWGFNPAHSILKIAEKFMDAHFSLAAQDTMSAIERMQEAVVLEDGLNYGEPPDWLFPTRPALGGIYLKDGNYTEAERVFRADLARNRRRAKSLFGLMLSLKEQNREYEADLVREEYQSVWKKADAPMRVERLVLN